MELTLRLYREEDLPAMTEIWNGVVEQADSFPGDHPLEAGEVAAMFAAQTRTVVALDGEEVVGLYILHPNNIGRCAQIANASYDVRRNRRGGGIGRRLVEAIERQARARGAVTMMLGTDDETGATSLSGTDLYENLWERIAHIRNLHDHPYSFYEKCGYTIVGVVPDANGYGRPDILMAKRLGKKP